ncbi:DMT family transporter, partial [bacterium]
MTKSKDSVSGQSPHYRSGITSSLFSAVLFGAATPAAKMLLDSIDPLVLAGLFYLGSGLVMLLWLALKRFFMGGGRQPGLALNDLGLLSLAVLFGGILGPMLLFAGLSSTPASTASLLLNLESVFTALVALFVFREHLGKRLILG